MMNNTLQNKLQDAVTSEAVSIILKHTDTRSGALCPCCEFKLTRWTGKKVTEHASACESLRAKALLNLA